MDRQDVRPHCTFARQTIVPVAADPFGVSYSPGMDDQPSLGLDDLPPQAARNRDLWNADADGYQELHAPTLEASGGMAWGVWQIPEAELRVLGDVRDRDILEFGCGAAQWSIALARAGAQSGWA